jgi:ABC-type nickel/cobalt efflux system permease component RcnA
VKAPSFLPAAAAALLLAVFLGGTAAAQTNPFTGRSPGKAETPAQTGTAGIPPEAAREETSAASPSSTGAATTAGTGFIYRLPYQAEILRFQRRLNSGLAGFIRELRDSPSPNLLFLILGMSFLYGFIHALLPGHRKMILFGYFLAEDARPIQGVLAGLFLAVLHAGASVLIIGAVYLVLRGAATISGSFENAKTFIQTASAWLLLAAGTVLLVLKIREAVGSHGTHDHEHGGHDHRAGRKRMLPFIVFSGMIPCPGASMILMFSLSLGIFSIGLLSVAAMSAGMAVTLVSVSVLTIILKERALRFFSGAAGHKLHTLVELGGAGFLLAFGLWLVVFMPPLG